MGWLLKLLGSGIVGIFGDAILKPVLAHLDTNATTERDIAVSGIGADKERDIALVTGQIEANRLRAASQPAFMALIYLIALPPAIHFGAVFLDSTPFWSPWGVHVVGSWQVPKPPAPYDSYQASVLLSFFVLSPALAAVKGVTAVLARR